MSDENNPLNIPKNPKIEKMSRVGVIILIVFVGGFLLWSTFFSLESAAVASGKIVIESNRKTIQHLEGGIVKEIFVKEGQEVNMGDKLIQLDKTQALANLEIIEGQTDKLLARQAWLVAARDKLDKVIFPERLLNKSDDPEIKQMMETSVDLFESYRHTIEDNVKTLNNQIEQSKSDIESLKAQADSNATQLKLINEELDAWAKLEKESYIDKPRILALKREAAKLVGDREQQLALVTKAEQKITEAELQKVNLKNTKENEILKQLDETEFNLASNLQKETETRDILNRSLIVAPITGIVLNLKVHTIGGVIASRESLMDIVPEQENLIVEAKVSPLDIDVVQPGLLARIRFTAYKQRSTPTVDGKVITVSADAMQEERTNESYYLARVKVDKEELMHMTKDVILYPGMPVQVLIVTDKRTPLEYFLKPITDSFARAFREE